MPPELATEYRVNDVCDHKDKIASTKNGNSMCDESHAA